MSRLRLPAVLLGAIATTALATEEDSQTTAADAAVISVSVSNVESAEGTIDCALFSSETGFPMDASEAVGIRHDARPGTVECRFENLSAGTYAVAVSHDENGNGKTDTNFVGIPKESWGVSNNVRPKMRAPKFDEAAFALKAGQVLAIEVKIK